MLSHHLGDSESLFIPRIVTHKNQTQPLSIWQLIDYWYSLPELGTPGCQTSYPSNDFDVFENSPDEIRRVVIEYLDRTDCQPTARQAEVSNYLRKSAKTAVLRNPQGYSDEFRFHLAQWSESTKGNVASSFIDNVRLLSHDS
jgi:hypothetical protein